MTLEQINRLYYIRGALAGVEGCINNAGAKSILAAVQEDLADLLEECREDKE